MPEQEPSHDMGAGPAAQADPELSDEQANRPGVGGTNERGTPAWFIDVLTDATGGFDLDACTRQQTEPHAIADHRFTPADDGLAQSWFGTVWVNPPFERGVIGKWAQKVWSEAQRDDVDHVYMLLSGNSVSTGWFHDYIEAADYFYIPEGRLSFLYPEEDQTNGAPFATVIAIFGTLDADAHTTLEEHGAVYERLPVDGSQSQQRISDFATDGAVATGRSSSLAPTAGVAVEPADETASAQPTDLGATLDRGNAITVTPAETPGQRSLRGNSLKLTVCRVQDPRQDTEAESDIVDVACCDDEGNIYALRQNIRHLGDITLSVEDGGRWSHDISIRSLSVEGYGNPVLPTAVATTGEA